MDNSAIIDTQLQVGCVENLYWALTRKWEVKEHSCCDGGNLHHLVVVEEEDTWRLFLSSDENRLTINNLNEQFFFGTYQRLKQKRNLIFIQYNINYIILKSFSCRDSSCTPTEDTCAETTNKSCNIDIPD